MNKINVENEAEKFSLEEQLTFISITIERGIEEVTLKEEILQFLKVTREATY